MFFDMLLIDHFGYVRFEHAGYQCHWLKGFSLNFRKLHFTPAGQCHLVKANRKAICKFYSPLKRGNSHFRRLTI